MRPRPFYYTEAQIGRLYLEKRRIAHNPIPAVIQERRTVCIMRAHRITSAQRGLRIRGLNESAGSGPGAEVSTDYFNKAELPFSIKYPAH